MQLQLHNTHAQAYVRFQPEHHLICLNSIRTTQSKLHFAISFILFNFLVNHTHTHALTRGHTLVLYHHDKCTPSIFETTCSSHTKSSQNIAHSMLLFFSARTVADHPPFQITFLLLNQEIACTLMCVVQRWNV